MARNTRPMDRYELAEWRKDALRTMVEQDKEVTASALAKTLGVTVARVWQIAASEKIRLAGQRRPVALIRKRRR